MTDKGNDVDNEATVAAGKWGIRHLQSFLLFLGMTIGYSMRVNMSVASVAMKNKTAANPDFEDFQWNNDEFSTVASSFFWGYLVLQVPSGYVAKVWSAQKLMAIGIAICGMLNIILPVAAHYGGLLAVCACRVGMGLSQCCLLPCVHTLMSKWAPPAERARLATFSYAGAQFGTVIALPISGFLCGSSVGWPSVFYLFGALALVWSIIFFIWGSDSPNVSRKITELERLYIEKSFLVHDNHDSKQKLAIPWKSIFTSGPMWALIIAHCGQNWGYWTLLTELPNYMKYVLGFQIQQGGWVSALPYLAMWILSFPISWLSDLALRRGTDRGVVRKVCNTLAHWGPAIALIVLAATPGLSTVQVIILIVVAVGLNAGSLCGFQINHMDLSPNFAGTMMSITNCLATIVAIIAPIICGKIAYDESDPALWGIVFYVAAAIYFVGNLVFIIMGQGVVQPWNEPDSRSERVP